ncbi:MAG TPA: IS1595 family transposase [Stellaceae bacterium]|jgi:transposase-like protein|nr:IS1595 family transposase [Stellaceae bacterium]
MAHSSLSAEALHNEYAAFEWVEAHLWPNGPICPHCGNTDAARIGRLQGKSARAGLRKCYACRKPFTVRIGTIFEDSHLALHLWLQAIYMMCSSKKGISTRQLQRTLGCGMKTAWHLGHRIRLAMDDSGSGQIGGGGKTVEADETFFSQGMGREKAPGYQHKIKVLSLVERGGNTRSMRIDNANAHEIQSAIKRHVHKDSRVVTDGAQYYKGVMMHVAGHESVDHSKGEYVRGDVHTNTLEGFFSVFKRGLVGIYQHIEEQHVDRYLAEFDFRQNTRAKLGINDTMRAEIALKGAKGKRLTYRTVSEPEPTDEIPF